METSTWSVFDMGRSMFCIMQCEWTWNGLPDPESIQLPFCSTEIALDSKSMRHLNCPHQSSLKIGSDKIKQDYLASTRRHNGCTSKLEGAYSVMNLLPRERGCWLRRMPEWYQIIKLYPGYVQWQSSNPKKPFMSKHNKLLCKWVWVLNCCTPDRHVRKKP